jgi:hypothetical protein
MGTEDVVEIDSGCYDVDDEQDEVEEMMISLTEPVSRFYFVR